MKNINILYENDLCLIVNKPAGLAVQGGKGIKSSLDKILAEIRTPSPLLVHRLDMDTSGIILTAKTKESAAVFSRLLNDRKNVKKCYIAVCAGSLENELSTSPKGEVFRVQGSITLDLQVRGRVKKSETRYKVLKNGSFTVEGETSFDYTVLEIELGSGRMHQIRRHLSMIGLPVLGDDKYGDFSLNKKLKKLGHKRLLLHARQLEIKSGIKLNVSAPLPEYFYDFYKL